LRSFYNAKSPAVVIGAPFVFFIKVLPRKARFIPLKAEKRQGCRCFPCQRRRVGWRL